MLLVCEHASHAVPPVYGTLGLDKADLTRHIAWDPGALDLAKAMSRLLDATLVHSSVSRLVFDCNRPFDAADAMPEKSETTVIPGNTALTDADRNERFVNYYLPFENLVRKTIDARGTPPILVTIHSFTPVYAGKTRDVEIGVLHDTDARLADSLLAVANGYATARNQPYGPKDGVTHTLRQHALPRGLLNAMIEVRNDLLQTSEQCAKLATVLATWLDAAIATLPEQVAEEVSR